MKKELKQEILEIIKNNNYERYSVFQDPETKELVLQCFFTDYYDDTIGEAVSFENYNEYTFEYDKELEDYLEDILLLKTTKYYLYDIQNDERVCEVDRILFNILEDTIFNSWMITITIDLILSHIKDYDVDDEYKKLDALENLQYDLGFLTDGHLHKEKIFKIIKFRG